MFQLINTPACVYMNTVQSAHDISNTVISKYPLISEKIVGTHFLFFPLHFNSEYFKLLISQSKFTLKYLKFGINFD